MKGNGTGRTGKSFQDRELAARVRTLTLLECEKALKKKKGKMYESVLLKLAGSVLPRLNEHSGPDGEPIPLFNYVKNRNNNGNSEDTET